MHAIHKSVWGRLKAWVHNHHIQTILMGGIGIIASTSLVAAAIFYQSPVQDKAPVSIKQTPTPTPAPVYYSPLTGMKVPDEATTKLPVTGVMIENSPDSRPQSGLKNSGIVFEAIAEGGITRFLVLYQESKPQMIGPVRSLRLYDVDWLAPFQASIAHVGGSKFALNEIRNGRYRDIDQFFNGAYYWRSTDRYAPHNVYTSFKKLDALNAKRNYTSSTFIAWPRQDGAPAKKTDAGTISVHISGPTYDSKYVYNSAKNTYTRYQAGALHLDREGGKITPSIVVVMNVNETTVFQDGYREQITTSGSGKARVFQNGTEIDAKWTKANRGGQIKFTDANDKEIVFNRGQTWITAIPANRGGKVTWQ